MTQNETNKELLEKIRKDKIAFEKYIELLHKRLEYMTCGRDLQIAIFKECAMGGITEDIEKPTEKDKIFTTQLEDNVNLLKEQAKSLLDEVGVLATALNQYLFDKKIIKK